MSSGGKITIPNQLWRTRKRIELGQKQLSLLLGKSEAIISLYEHGLVIPPLETALALELLYGIPISKLFDGLKKQLEKNLQATINRNLRTYKILQDNDQQQNFCSYIELISKSQQLTQSEIGKLRDHITFLAKKLAYL
jgi:transcriptional regulator with XRE-family HTH domain